MMMLSSCGPSPGTSGSYHAEGADSYNKTDIIDRYSGDLDSDLSVFPDEIDTERAEFTADFASNLFDTDGSMILSCEYDDAGFSEEIGRLKSLSKTIESSGESVTNHALYDEETYPYPAYITIDGFGNTYEYALIDQEHCRIIYIYLAYPDAKTLSKYQDYVKLDLSAYDEENTMGAYSMYNHSFDGGESWVEFDDQ